MEFCANNPSEWVLGVTSNGPMAKGVCKEGKRKEENLKRRNLERESGKVLLVAFVDSWMRGSAWCRHDPQPARVACSTLSVDRPKTTNSVLPPGNMKVLRVLTPRNTQPVEALCRVLGRCGYAHDVSSYQGMPWSNVVARCYPTQSFAIENENRANCARKRQPERCTCKGQSK